MRTRRSSEREPADSLRDESDVTGGWLPSLTFALDRIAFMEQQWYSVRSIFKLPASRDGQRPPLFEERVVIFRAATPGEALEKGRAEAKRYSEGEKQPSMLDHVVVFGVWEEELREGEEVWSCLRQLNVSDEEFLDRVYEGEQLGLRHLE